MRLAVLTRNRNLHSIRRLLQEASKLGVQLDTINPLECQIIVDGRQSRVVVGTQQLPEYDAVLPRIGASITSYGLAVVQQFEAMGTTTINTAEAIAQSRDKFRISLRKRQRAHLGLGVLPEDDTKSGRQGQGKNQCCW